MNGSARIWEGDPDQLNLSECPDIVRRLIRDKSYTLAFQASARLFQSETWKRSRSVLQNHAFLAERNGEKSLAVNIIKKLSIHEYEEDACPFSIMDDMEKSISVGWENVAPNTEADELLKKIFKNSEQVCLEERGFLTSAGSPTNKLILLHQGIFSVEDEHSKRRVNLHSTGRSVLIDGHAAITALARSRFSLHASKGSVIQVIKKETLGAELTKKFAQLCILKPILKRRKIAVSADSFEMSGGKPGELITLAPESFPMIVMAGILMVTDKDKEGNVELVRSFYPSHVVGKHHKSFKDQRWISGTDYQLFKKKSG